MRKTLALLFAFLIGTLLVTSASADELSDVQKKINQKNSEYSLAQQTLARLKSDIASINSSLSGTESELADANAKVEFARKELAQVEETLNEKQKTLAYLIEIRNKQIRAIYTHPSLNTFEMFISSETFASFPQMATYQEKVVGDSHSLIEIVNEEVIAYQKTQTEMQNTKNELEAAASAVAARASELRNRYYATTAQQNNVQTQVNQVVKNLKDLTVKQQALVAAKLAATSQNSTVGSSAPTSTPLPNPGFNPAYAIASYGYPHRVGMNQYGAYGRALTGQNYQTILKAYYAGVTVGAYPTPSTIKVAGYGTISLEDNYLKGISEMPRSWPLEALKAQAVAARTYAMKWLQDHPGGSICTTQACQVYNGARINGTSAADQNWYRAVAETRGIVITYAGSPISAWYSSTNGGYTLSSQEVWGGSVPYAKGIKDYVGSWPAGAYDGPKYGNSPWFHKPWGTSGCGGAGGPWMTKAQMADIFNSILLSRISSSYNQYLSPPDGCLGPAGWSFQKVKDELRKRGVADAGDIGNVFTAFDGRGNSSTVSVVSSNYGALVFNASQFRSIFSLRSPGTLSIQTTLFDTIICPPTCK